MSCEGRMVPSIWRNDPAIFSSNFSVKKYSVLLPAVVTGSRWRPHIWNAMTMRCSGQLVPRRTHLLPFKSCYDTGSRRWKSVVPALPGTSSQTQPCSWLGCPMRLLCPGRVSFGLKKPCVECCELMPARRYCRNR